MRASFFILSLTLLLFSKPTSLPILMEKTDKFLYTHKNEIRVEKIDSTIPFYLAYAYATINEPFYKVAPELANLEKYDDLFKHITDIRQVQDWRHPKDTIYYIEGKTSFVHGWGLGKLVEFDVNSTQISLKVRPASMALIKQYMRERRGKIKYYIRDVYLDGDLIPIDSKSCRIGIRGVSSTNKPIPTWLLSLIMKIIFPGLIKDIETGVKLRDEKILLKKSAPKAAPKSFDYIPNYQN